MSKADLIERLSEEMGVSKAMAKEVLDAFLDEISQALKNGEKVMIPGFGSFFVKERSERAGRNPATGQAMTIPASKVPSFKPGKGLKEAVN